VKQLVENVSLNVGNDHLPSLGLLHVMVEHGGEYWTSSGQDGNMATDIP
jgi:hypothetical protein